jgi:anti-anti-sigma factor
VSERVPQPFAVAVESQADGCARVAVCGEVDLLTAPALRAALDRELSRRPRVVLDLSQVAFIDSSGLRAILLAQRDARPSGATLQLHSTLPPNVRRLFELVGALRALQLTD